MIHEKPLPPDIAERLETLDQALAGCPGVVFAYLFGGAATGAIRPLSDVDLAVYFDEGLSPTEARLTAIGTATRHLGTEEVDVVVLNSAPTALVGRILMTRKVILDRHPFTRHRFESRMLREFFDFRFFEQRLLALRYASRRPGLDLTVLPSPHG